MTIQERVQLRSFNTLGLTSVAEFFVRATSSEGVLEALQVARAKNLCVRAIGKSLPCHILPTFRCYLGLSIGCLKNG